MVTQHQMQNSSCHGPASGGECWEPGAARVETWSGFAGMLHAFGICKSAEDCADAKEEGQKPHLMLLNATDRLCPTCSMWLHAEDCAVAYQAEKDRISSELQVHQEIETVAIRHANNVALNASWRCNAHTSSHLSLLRPVHECPSVSCIDSHSHSFPCRGPVILS